MFEQRKEPSALVQALLLSSSTNIFLKWHASGLREVFVYPEGTRKTMKQLKYDAHAHTHTHFGNPVSTPRARWPRGEAAKGVYRRYPPVGARERPLRHPNRRKREHLRRRTRKTTWLSSGCRIIWISSPTRAPKRLFILPLIPFIIQPNV